MTIVICIEVKIWRQNGFWEWPFLRSCHTLKYGVHPFRIIQSHRAVNNCRLFYRVNMPPLDRIPLNLIVVGILLSDFSMRQMFIICSCFLCLSCCCQQILYQVNPFWCMYCLRCYGMTYDATEQPHLLFAFTQMNRNSKSLASFV